MTSTDGPYAVYLLLAIVLVASALVGRRIPLGKAAAMALAWAAIFAVMFALFTYRSELRAVGARLHAAAFGQPVALANGDMRIDMAPDGHFWATGKLNGTDVRFLIDSGATVTTVSAKTAAAAGIRPTSRRSVIETANGQIVVSQAVANSLSIGAIERRDFPVNISEREGVDTLGMNFLSSLSGWRVERGELVMRP